MRDDIIVFIMAGGIGTRFWPASQKKYAKQFHRLVDKDRSLLQGTYDRFCQLVSNDKIYVITSADQVGMTKEHLPDLQDHQIIGEPQRKNTGPATLLGSIIGQHMMPGCSCIFTPADATINDHISFISCLEKAADFIKNNDGIVTIGIRPREPHTGYGYIEYNQINQLPYPVISFKEKPDRETAESYIEAKRYLWNAGIFIWRADYILQVFSELASNMFEKFGKLKFINGALDTDSLERVYTAIESESVDYLIMEKASKVFTIPGDFGWSDIGNWRALYEYLPKNNHGNVVQANKHLFKNVQNSYIKSYTDKLIVIKDLDGYAVVETEKTLLIYPLNQEQDIKSIRAQIQEEMGEDYI